jgi:hypothetical protein
MLLNIAPRIASYKAAAEPSMLFDQAKVDTNGSCAPVDYLFDCVLQGEPCHSMQEHLKENLFALQNASPNMMLLPRLDLRVSVSVQSGSFAKLDMVTGHCGIVSKLQSQLCPTARRYLVYASSSYFVIREKRS